MRNTFIMFIFVFMLNACGKKYSDLLPSSALGTSIIFAPVSGSANTPVTIIGRGFSTNPNLDLVFFNGVAAPVLKASSDTLLVMAPVGGNTGIISIKVGSDQVLGGSFTYTNASSFLVSPVSGLIATQLTFTAQNITIKSSDSIVVLFSGGAKATVIYRDAHQIITKVPAGFKTGPTSLKIGSNTYPGPLFTQFSLTSVKPIWVNGVQNVIIKGTGFNASPLGNFVIFEQFYSPSSAPIDSNILVTSSWTDSILVRIPQGDTSGRIKVSPNGRDFLNIPFPVLSQILIVANIPLNGITAFSSGIPIVLLGSGFNPDPAKNSLSLGGLACTILHVSKTGDSMIYLLPELSNLNHSGSGAIHGPFILQSGNIITTLTYPTNAYSDPITFNAGPSYTYQEVSTLAGGSYGLSDGNGVSAQFKTLSGITIDLQGNIYVTDREANNIRKITPNGTVSIFAGSPTGASGYQDQYGIKALFNAPCGIIYVSSENYFLVADSGNFRIRQIMPNGLVSTFAGTGVQGGNDGSYTSTQFMGPNSLFIYIDPNAGTPISYIYIADQGIGKGSIRQLNTQTLMVSTLATGLSSPKGITKLANNNPINFTQDLLYIDSKDQVIGDLNTNKLIDGILSTPGYVDNYFPGYKKLTATLNQPSGVINAGLNPNLLGIANEMIYLSDKGNNAIRNIAFNYNQAVFGSNYSKGYIYTFVGGGLSLNGSGIVGGGKAGYIDGGFRTALFNGPGQLTYDPFGNIFVCDIGNHAIRKIFINP